MEKCEKNDKDMYGDEAPPPYTAYPADAPPPPVYKPPQEEKVYNGMSPTFHHHTNVFNPFQQPFFVNHVTGQFGEPSLMDLANNVTLSANRLAAAASASAYQASMGMPSGMPSGIPMGMPTGGLTSYTTKVIQLISPVTGRAVRVLSDGRIDAMATPNDPAAQFIQLDQGNNVVILRNAAKQDYHLEVVKDQLIGNGSGSDFNAQFRIYTGKGGLVSFESMSSPGQNIGVNTDGTIKMTECGTDSHFNVRVLASNSVTTSHPAGTFVTQQYHVK